jgi:hypothetical protein
MTVLAYAIETVRSILRSSMDCNKAWLQDIIRKRVVTGSVLSYVWITILLWSVGPEIQKALPCSVRTK